MMVARKHDPHPEIAANRARLKKKSLRQQVDILHLCDPEVRENFLATVGITVFRSRLPDGIGVVTSGDGQEKYLVATRGFEVGDVIFENRVERIMRNSDLANEYLLEVDVVYRC